MSWENVMTDLILTLTPILSVIVIYVLVIIARFVVGNTNNTVVKAALANLEQIIFSTVTALSQTFVDDLKRTKPNGKLTDEEADFIKNKALSSIRNQIGSKDLDVLVNNFGSVDELIDNILEQKVAENKLRRGDI